MPRILTAIVSIAVLASAVALAADADPRTDRELKSELRQLDREVDDQQRLAEKLERAGRSSSNSHRNSVVEDLRRHMADAVVRREDILGQEHTIKQHGEEVGGLTDAADVGTPIPSKKTRRRVRKGEAEEHPQALRRLTRMQTIVVSARRIELPAVERQGDSFERYAALVEEFGDIIALEQALVQAELDRRAGAVAEADSPGGPDQ